MNKITALLITTLLFIFTHTQLYALDLIQVYQLAIKQDVQLMMAQSQYDSTRYTLPQAQSANRPQLNLSANTSYINADSSVLMDDEQTITSYSLNLKQSLYNPQNESRIEIAVANIQMVKAELRAAKQNLQLRVTEAYFAILSAQDNVAFAQAETHAIARQLEQANKRFEVGLVAITDVKEAQASYDSSMAQEIMARNTLDNAREALAVIVGRQFNDNIAHLAKTPPLELVKSSHFWVEKAQQFNLNILAAQSALQAASENRNIARSEDTPNIDLIASYGGNNSDSQHLGFSSNNDFTLSVQLNVPLYSGGRIRSTISKAEADYHLAQNNVLLQKRLSAQKIRTAYLAVESGIAQVNALQQALESSTAALEATESGFQVGTRTSIDVLNSLRNTFRAKRDYASARYDAMINTLKLKQAAGVLKEEDLRTINQGLL